MPGETWRLMALFFFYVNVFTESMPWLVVHWGRTWGLVAGVVLGVFASFVVLVPVRDRRTGAHRVRS